MLSQIDDFAWDVLDEVSGLERLTASFYRVQELTLKQTITELESQPEKYTARFLELLSAANSEPDNF